MKTLIFSLLLASSVSAYAVSAYTAPNYSRLIEPIGTLDYAPVVPLVDYDALKLQRSQQQYYDLQNELAKQQMLQLQQMQLKQQYPAPYVPWR